MRTVHADALGRMVDRVCRENPRAAANLARIVGMMRRGEGQTLIDAVVQKSVGRTYDIYDAFSYITVDNMLARGELAWVFVPAGAEPRPDREAGWFADFCRRFVTARAACGESWSATFHGGKADEDGWLEWARPEEFSLIVEAGTARVLLPKGRAPLEIGTTAASRSLLHIRQDGALARWPYGHDRIHVLVKTKVIESLTPPDSA